jgi:hypothetical protein
MVEAISQRTGDRSFKQQLSPKDINRPRLLPFDRHSSLLAQNRAKDKKMGF